MNSEPGKPGRSGIPLEAEDERDELTVDLNGLKKKLDEFGEEYIEINLMQASGQRWKVRFELGLD